MLTTFGVDPRHMRQARNAASRDAHLIGTAMAHLTGEERTEAAARMLDAPVTLTTGRCGRNSNARPRHPDTAPPHQSLMSQAELRR